MRNYHWTEPYNLPDGIKTLLTPSELAMLYNLGRSRYSGVGHIVDAGCFVGGSTRALLDGLDVNDRFQRSSYNVHAYDLFRTTDQFNTWGDEVTCFQNGAGYLKEFKSNIANYLDRTIVHEGDILENGWLHGPVEILFIDIAKSPLILRHVYDMFLPHMVAGQSYLVHQDFQYPGYPWIVASMQVMSDYWKVIDFLPNNTAVYQLIKPVPRELLIENDWHKLTRDSRQALHRRALEKLPIAGHLMLRLNEVEWLLEEHKEASARDLIEELRLQAKADANAYHQIEVTVRRLYGRLLDDGL